MQGRRIVGLGLSFVAAMAVSAAGPDEDYVRIYKGIVEADALKDSGRLEAAAKLYQTAQESLHQLQVSNPAWNERLIIFRINYVAGQLKLLRGPSAPVTLPATPSTPQTTPPVAGAANQLESQLQQLREENQGLRGAAQRLEAKLREALSSQPAQADPREMEKLQNQMRDLTKENELLKVTLDHQTKPLPGGITNTVVRTVTNTVYSILTNTLVNTVTNRVVVDSAELANLRRGLTNQMRTLVILRSENDVLKKELAQAKAAPAPAPTVVPSTPELDRQLKEAVQELKSTQQVNQDLVKKQSNLEQMLSDARSAQEAQLEKIKRFDELEKNLTTSRTDNQRLSEQKQALEKKLASAPAPASTDVETSKRLVKLEKDLLESQSEIRLRTRQKADLEIRLSEVRTAAAQQASAAAAVGPAVQITPGAGGEAASTEMHRQLKQAAWEVLNLQAKNSELVQKQGDLQQQLARATSSKGTYDSVDADRLRRLEQLNKELSDTKQSAVRLEQENQQMANLLTEARQSSSKNPKDETARRQLTDAQAQLRQAEAANRELQKRSLDLEKQIADFRALAISPGKDAPDSQKPERLSKDLAMAREAARQLQEDNRILEKKVSLAEQGGRSGVKGSSKSTERELAMLRNRLEIIEAKAVPYSEEELSLFSRLEVNLATTPPGSDDAKPSSATSPGKSEGLSEARNDFESGKFAEAERKFEAALKSDDRNLYTLAHLAASQFEQQKIAEADKTTQRALALSPEDPPALYLLGIIRLRQDRLDEALDALGRSAKANPQNAVTQNHLGVALSQKGLRESAETAFRKSLQIRPDYPDAHYNLAVEYVLQQPPSHKLAQWHYQKAVTAGHPRNTELEKRLESASATPK